MDLRVETGTRPHHMMHLAVQWEEVLTEYHIAGLPLTVRNMFLPIMIAAVIFTADLICIISDCGIMRRQKANLEAVLHSRLSALTKIRECPERLT